MWQGCWSRPSEDRLPVAVSEPFPFGCTLGGFGRFAPNIGGTFHGVMSKKQQMHRLQHPWILHGYYMDISIREGLRWTHLDTNLLTSQRHATLNRLPAAAHFVISIPGCHRACWHAWQVVLTHPCVLAAVCFAVASLTPFTHPVISKCAGALAELRNRPSTAVSGKPPLLLTLVW